VTVIDVILEEIERKVHMTQEDLGAGAAKDYAEYRYVCGCLNGMLAVKRYVEEIKSNLEND
jgi:hypothetical protein